MSRKKGSVSGDRLSRGRARGAASFPVGAPSAELPESYASLLAELKARIQAARTRAVVHANQAAVALYWDIGRLILERQASEGWGAGVIDRLASDLRAAYPDMTGISGRNLLFMRAFADAYRDAEIVKQPVSQLPWGHIIRLLQRVKDPATRDWYARHCVLNGWSRAVLELEIDHQAHARQGRAISNFNAAMPPDRSDLAAAIFKDPYVFDFLGTADARREREVEQALVDHVQKFLLELGAGFAFVGRQVHLEIGDHDFYVDLLFFHLKLRCFVVIELKATPFDSAYVGQLNLYLSAVDDLLRHADDKPTIGLLLCRSKDSLVVEYALRDLSKPIGVAGWRTQLVDSLPAELEGVLPTVEEIEAELGAKRR